MENSPAIPVVVHNYRSDARCFQVWCKLHFDEVIMERWLQGPISSYNKPLQQLEHGSQYVFTLKQGEHQQIAFVNFV